jgi:hypothetical protein
MQSQPSLSIRSAVTFRETSLSGPGSAHRCYISRRGPLLIHHCSCSSSSFVAVLPLPHSSLPSELCRLLFFFLARVGATAACAGSLARSIVPPSPRFRMVSTSDDDVTDDISSAVACSCMRECNRQGCRSTLSLRAKGHPPPLAASPLTTHTRGHSTIAALCWLVGVSPHISQRELSSLRLSCALLCPHGHAALSTLHRT